MKVKEGVYEATDLLTKDKDTLGLKRDGVVRMTLDARDAVVLKMKV